MKYLTEEALFAHGPLMWANWETNEWIHRGHVDDATAHRALDTWADGSVFDKQALTPGTVQHVWMRFAEHDPRNGCDDVCCHCEARSDLSYLWWERTSPGTQGAIPITWMKSHSILQTA